MKKITFASPVAVEVQPVVTTEDAPEARIVDRNIHTDPFGNTTISVSIGLFNASNEQIGGLGPFSREWPAAWDAQLDTLDEVALAWLKDNEIDDGVIS